MLYMQSAVLGRLADGDSALAVQYSDENGRKLLVDHLVGLLPRPIPSRTAVVTIVTTNNPVYASGMATGRRIWKPLDILQIPIGDNWVLELEDPEVVGVRRGVSRDTEELTEVDLTFAKITLEHKSGKTLYQDDWSA